MTELHRYLAYSVPVGFALLALWTLYGFIRNKTPGDWFWHLLAFLQVVLGVEILLGAALFLAGNRPVPPSGPVWLHYVYGGLFPATLLVLAHRFAKTRWAEIPWLPFGVVALVNFGLTFRALQTGLG